MKSFALFIFAFLTVAALMVAMELSNDQPDYQAYTRPKNILEEMK